ncbi:SAM-dependent methyltransferase [Nonomuraea sp. CA-141351]|uniref:SAM-dependent methyltransferase n=1 Tax=Nonomuraea sp. CA-141351 TaxID=3239996 RepID=UPI003D9040F6
MTTDVPVAPSFDDKATAANALASSLRTPSSRSDLSAIARAYDVGLGGKDHPDRIAFEKLLKIEPRLPVAMSENRAFLGRAVMAASLLDIKQFLNLGSGLPSPDGISVTDVARRYHPDARIVHVDVAELVAVYGRALLARDDNVLVVHEDARDPDRMLKQAAELLDLEEPACIIATAVAHFWADSDDPAGVLRHYMRAFPAGYLILSHACGEEMSPDDFAQLRATYEEAFASIYPRTRAQIVTFLDGLEPLEPGLVEASQWRNDDRQIDVGKAYFLAAVAGFGLYAQKPARSAA